MSFREYLESIGAMGVNPDSDWANDMVNGSEYARKGIRDKHQSTDLPAGDDYPRGKRRKTPEMVMGKLRKPTP